VYFPSFQVFGAVVAKRRNGLPKSHSFASKPSWTDPIRADADATLRSAMRLANSSAADWVRRYPAEYTARTAVALAAASLLSIFLAGRFSGLLSNMLC
jgi:hypothetical protein